MRTKQHLSASDLILEFGKHELKEQIVIFNTIKSLLDEKKQQKQQELDLLKTIGDGK